MLCDAWPGLARQNSPLVEIVLGAQSRVAGYERIKVANHLREERLALAARAAEPLAIALAELLANATAYSHPDTEVTVTLQQSGGRGAFLVVDDAGIGMDEDTLDRARLLLAGPSEVLLTELGDPPQTGFAVVGRLVVQYGFHCHIEASPFGGMRTILRVPAHLLTVLKDDRSLSALAPTPVSAQPAPAETAAQAETAAPAVTAASAETAASVGLVAPARDASESESPVAAEPPGAGGPETDVPETGSSGGDAATPVGLPSRRRRAPRPSPVAATAPAAPAAGRMSRTPEQAESSWAALQQGTLNGRSVAGRAPAPDSDSHDHLGDQDDQGDDEK
ncbi:ATP-binding protein [Streptomyces sp. RKAG290]|uniref:ATP-binding protein n=1 Tax=Streptomyces sp. RKAG290 TaxID=2888348 RepID=UPI0020333AD9|nr:ATP-binding protein [Streptomyces sp. RKAG290]MCM2411131.1 ATP-binding protein [Streptomyces sp. RKAG290]